MMKKRARREKFKKIMAHLIYWTGAYFFLSLLYQRKKTVVILAYHKLEPQQGKKAFISSLGVTVDAFDKQIKYCSQKYRLVSIKEAINLLRTEKELKRNYLVCTFDDGYRNNYDHGMDVFTKYRLTPIIYLPTGYIDTGETLWHDQVEQLVRFLDWGQVDIPSLGLSLKLSNNNDKMDLAYTLMQKIKHHAPKERAAKIKQITNEIGVHIEKKDNELLTWQEIKRMADAGIDFGSHTMSHRILTQEALGELEDELYLSKEKIIDVTASKEVHFAYPDGKLADVDDRIEQKVKEIYASAVTTEPGHNYPGCDVHRLKRVGVIKEMDLTYLKVKILLAKILN
ncbi:MAG: polysaccharide deacetylase family protein [Dehalobacterium sp.]|jgi:peptidoglycan/xylan/chitin deacetylase (PgdA/CDA1 family)